MTALAARRPAGHYRFGHLAHMEFIKLRTLRSTWWTLAISAAGAVAIGVAVGLNTRSGTEDLTNNALAGLIPALLLSGVLGALLMTSEYSSGMIRSTLAAAPRRPLLLAAKAAVFGAVALAFGEAASFIAFFAGGAALRHGISAPALSQPGVLRAVVFGGAGYCLLGLIGLGLGAIIRHSAADHRRATSAACSCSRTFIGNLVHQVGVYLPIIIVGNSLTTTQSAACRSGAADCTPFLSAWAGLGVLALYAAVALAAGGWLFARRDA